MSTSYATAPEQIDARTTLSRFVRQQADRAARDLGFGWIGVAAAPSTYPQLRGAFAHSQTTSEPLPISNLFCEDTVFIEPADNVAFRFWHDTSHCRLGLSFALPDEWELAQWHLDQLTDAGYGPGTAEHHLLRLDLFGQIILLALAGRFPHNQGDFTRLCAELDLERGVLAELRRIA